MPAPLPAVLALLALLTSAPARSEPEPWDTSGARHLELTAENMGEAHTIRVSPHQLTGLVFNAPLQSGGVDVEDPRQVKVAVNEAEGMVTLLPSDALAPDRPLAVTVRFADGMVPERVTFRLVLHPTRAEHQVQVYRRPRSAESYRLGEQQERERAERCEAALEVERARPGQPPGGLADLFDTKLVSGGQGIAARNISTSTTQRPGEALTSPAAYSYHSVSLNQVAVELKVRNTSPLPWTAAGVEGTELVSPEGVRLRIIRVMQPAPIPPGESRQLVIVAEASVEQAQGTFLLRLGEARGPRTLTLRGVTFP